MNPSAGLEMPVTLLAGALSDVRRGGDSHRNACLWKSTQSSTLPLRVRTLMRSKLSTGQVQFWLTSSISNMQLGGTCEDWIGDRSTPRTSAPGFSSAKSLSGAD